MPAEYWNSRSPGKPPSRKLREPAATNSPGPVPWIPIVCAEETATIDSRSHPVTSNPTCTSARGPLVELDLRILYLKDLELLGATVMPYGIFEDLVGYIERGEIEPLLAKIFPLEDLREAQTAFLEKRHVGNFVITVT